MAHGAFMTLEQLKYMRAIVEQGSFRAAAASVFRSQSSLSISIKKLEHELGIQLFDRDHYRPQLTDAGKAIYQKSLSLLKKEYDITNLAQHLAAGSEAEVRLAVAGIIPLEPIIQALNHVDSLYPNTRITLLIENLGGTMERMYDDVDIAITDSFEFNTGFDYKTLMKVAFISVVPSSSVWAKKAQHITEKDLEDETIIVVRDTSIHSPRISKGLIEGAPQWVVNDFATKKHILCSGKGWGRMPLHLVQDELKQGILTQLDSPSFNTFHAPISLVRKKNSSKGPVIQALWSTLHHINWQHDDPCSS